MSALVEHASNDDASTASTTTSINYEDYTNYADAPVVEKPIICENCGSDSFDEDESKGDVICRGCGLVTQAHLVSLEAEYRVFADDSASQKKVHYTAYNPYMEYSLTEGSKLERDEKEFLWDGMKNIDEVFYKLTKGDSFNRPVQDRAKELFQKAFRLQLAQKKGQAPMKRNSGVETVRFKNRQKFSRRKQFVVSCLHQALKEHNILTWQIEDLSGQLDGIPVSKHSVRACLKDLGLESPEQ